MTGHDPIAEFAELFARAGDEEPGDATACVLATASADGRPSARMVLLKKSSPDGFVFFTNYESRKGRELAANPRAALCFYWATIGWQVRIEGTVERLSPEESDAYFASRPRLSRIAAWASRQSRPLASRAALLARFARYQAKHAVGEVPRPECWGGFRLVPATIELWSSAAHRLHDRRLYRRRDGGWEMERLYP